MHADIDHPSVAAREGCVALIQLGQEFECALTRGWLRRLREGTAVRVVTQRRHCELLDIGGDPSDCIALDKGAVALLRAARRLKALAPRSTVLLDGTLSGRILAAWCRAQTPAATVTPPALPSQLDAALAQRLAPLGVDRPRRDRPLRLCSDTRRSADRLLEGLGIDTRQSYTLFAPSSQTCEDDGWSARLRANASMPVLLLPQGHELDLIQRLAGSAYFVRAPELALRAALIGRADFLVSDDPAALEMAELMHTQVAAESAPEVSG